jgi:uncharacterized protein YhhL (DUF1145 family)
MHMFHNFNNIYLKVIIFFLCYFHLSTYLTIIGTVQSPTFPRLTRLQIFLIARYRYLHNDQLKREKNVRLD